MLLSVMHDAKARKILLGRPRCKWKEHIKMHLREIALDGMDLIHLAQDKDYWRSLLNTVLNIRIP
jgi:hypothetical protein